jgi:CPA1 family monovalent cation:H+ antiporter
MLKRPVGKASQAAKSLSAAATAGLLISTFLVGGAIYFVIGRIGLDLPLTYCLVFGALISPTDPVAVLGILKTATAPEPLEAKIACESLFNDGVGIVVFTILVAGPGGETLTAFDIGKLFVMEALGGALLGLIAAHFVSVAAPLSVLTVLKRALFRS